MTLAMNQDALERLRNRAKPTVESRDLSTIPSVNHNNPPLAQVDVTDVSNSSNQDIKISTSTDATDKYSSTSSHDGLASSIMELKTKQSTVRLEHKISQKISQKCQLEEISREVFIEALFVYFDNHKSIQSKVLQEARKRDKQRQKIANYRRAKSMIERFGTD